LTEPTKILNGSDESWWNYICWRRRHNCGGVLEVEAGETETIRIDVDKSSSHHLSQDATLRSDQNHPLLTRHLDGAVCCTLQIASEKEYGKSPAAIFAPELSGGTKNEMKIRNAEFYSRSKFVQGISRIIIVVSRTVGIKSCCAAQITAVADENVVKPFVL